ncbi:MAG: insulinase family protein [Actinobacteria bacterium]|nr:insulinase family protein [Actinomycetota bacterium]
MQNTKLQERVTRIASFKGIEVYRIKEEKFKTNSINIFFIDNLSKERATLNALLPAVLRRGCQRHPTLRDIALYLEELYGASFDCGVSKKGEDQIIQFYIDYAADKYTGDAAALSEKAFELLMEIITQPVLENRSFKPEYVQQEKENLKSLITGRVNDKMQYTVERCFEEMCRGEAFGIYEYGSLEDIEGIDEKMLFDHYAGFVETLPIRVYFTGSMEDAKINAMIDRLSEIRRGTIKNIEKSVITKKTGEVKNIEEKMSVNQGKLSLGFRTGVSPADTDYYTLVVYNSILGGGVHSKLFQNVREKESLAYYAFSRLEKFKGLMVISSGIEIEKREKAVKIILEQMDEIKAGNISDYEYESAQKTIETGINSLKDAQLQVVDFYLSQAIAGTDDNFDNIIEKFKNVSRKEIADIAGKIQLDTVYFLTSNQ